MNGPIWGQQIADQIMQFASIKMRQKEMQEQRIWEDKEEQERWAREDALMKQQRMQAEQERLRAEAQERLQKALSGGKTTYSGYVQSNQGQDDVATVGWEDPNSMLWLAQPDQVFRDIGNNLLQEAQTPTDIALAMSILKGEVPDTKLVEMQEIQGGSKVGRLSSGEEITAKDVLTSSTDVMQSAVSRGEPLASWGNVISGLQSGPGGAAEALQSRTTPTDLQQSEALKNRASAANLLSEAADRDTGGPDKNEKANSEFLLSVAKALPPERRTPYIAAAIYSGAREGRYLPFKVGVQKPTGIKAWLKEVLRSNPAIDELFNSLGGEEKKNVIIQLENMPEFDAAGNRVGGARETTASTPEVPDLITPEDVDAFMEEEW